MAHLICSCEVSFPSQSDILRLVSFGFCSLVGNNIIHQGSLMHRLEFLCLIPGMHPNTAFSLTCFLLCPQSLPSLGLWPGLTTCHTPPVACLHFLSFWNAGVLMMSKDVRIYVTTYGLPENDQVKYNSIESSRFIPHASAYFIFQLSPLPALLAIVFQTFQLIFLYFT